MRVSEHSKRQRALAELDRYARMAVDHSVGQYEREGTLHAKALALYDQAAVWDKPWVPEDFDLGRAHEHPVFQHRFSTEQKLAWNHLQWGLDYSIVGKGELQIIVINKYAVKAFEGLLPSVIELEERESFEEVDHYEAFKTVIDGLTRKYLPHRREPLYAFSPSGFRGERANKVMRHAVGQAGRLMLGNHFPAMFFLSRGLKTHNFKPFENAIASWDQAPKGIREISHLHRLDESRHMATSLWLAKLSNDVLDTVPYESRTLVKAAAAAAWPKGRMAESRVDYWRQVLDEAPIYQDVPKPERADLLDHVRRNTEAGLAKLHFRQEQLTRQANKRIVEECGLPLHLKQAFVGALRKDPATAPMVEAVELPAA